MKIPTFKCPHCGNDLGTAVDAYLYGSPLRICNKCKNSYIDKRYHEIAIEGIRQEDINPAMADKKSHRKSGLGSIGIGIGALVLFVVFLAVGWIVFPLPIIGVGGLITGIKSLCTNPAKELEKTRNALEIERQQSVLRMQDPQYVEKLRSIGYNIPIMSQSNINQTNYGAAPQTFCVNCGSPIGQNERFCSHCGQPH